MRLKQVLVKILLLSALALFFGALPPTPTRADECGGDCSVVECNCRPIIGPDGEPDEVCDWCTACGGGGCESGQCPSGMYRAPDGSCHDIGEGGEETCFPAGTKIEMADGTRKNIEEVRIGDTVVSQDEWGRRASSTVTQLIQPISDNMCKIEFEDGDKLEVTKSHPLMTDTGWKAIDVGAAAKEKESVPVTKLEVGDKMVKVDGTNPVVSEIACWDEQVQTYNLTVDNDHTYFAGGYLAHNKGGIATDCVPPYSCPANSACTPQGGNYCNTNNINYNSSTKYYVDRIGSYERDCRIGNAQSLIREYVGYDTWYWYLYQYACCPAGRVSTYKYEWETYYFQREYNASAGGYPERNACGAGEITVKPPGTGYAYGTLVSCRSGQPWVKGEGFTQYCTYLIECRKRKEVHSCTPLCPRPTAPELVSPDDGDQLSSTSVGLQWNASNFGTGCSGTYTVYVGTSNPPTSSIYLGTNTSVNLTNLTRGRTYYWYVRAENESSGANSGVRSFTILNNQITGQVFYDPTNTCSGSGWSSGGVSVSLDGGVGTPVSGTGTLVV